MCKVFCSQQRLLKVEIYSGDSKQCALCDGYTPRFKADLSILNGSKRSASTGGAKSSTKPPSPAPLPHALLPCHMMPSLAPQEETEQLGDTVQQPCEQPCEQMEVE